MKFIDLACNSGVIFEGDQAHFDGLAWLGGDPYWISDAQAFKLMQTPLCEDEILWRYQSAPTLWASNNGRPY